MTNGKELHNSKSARWVHSGALARSIALLLDDVSCAIEVVLLHILEKPTEGLSLITETRCSMSELAMRE
jgi:hypothetical protein